MAYRVARRNYGSTATDYQVAVCDEGGKDFGYRGSIAIAGHNDSRCRTVTVTVLGNYEPFTSREKDAIRPIVEDWAKDCFAWTKKPVRVLF